MKFIWVNGRTPSSQSACAECSRAIGAAYLRGIETRLFYCDHDCYAAARPEVSRLVQSHSPISCESDVDLGPPVGLRLCWVTEFVRLIESELMERGASFQAVRLLQMPR